MEKIPGCSARNAWDIERPKGFRVELFIVTTISVIDYNYGGLGNHPLLLNICARRSTDKQRRYLLHVFVCYLLSHCLLLSRCTGNASSAGWCACFPCWTV